MARTFFEKWCRPEDLNPQPTDYKSVALPIELGRQYIKYYPQTEISCNGRPAFSLPIQAAAQAVR